MAVTALVIATAGCGSESHADDIVATVAGTPIQRTQLDWTVERARAAAKRDGKDFPEDGSPEFRRLRHRLLAELVVDAEIVKSANRLHVAVPTAAVYEFAEEQGGEEQGGGGSGDEHEQDIAFARSAVRAHLLYEAIARKVASGTRLPERQVERYYRSHLAEFGRKSMSPPRARLLIETKLLQERQNEAMQRWVSAMKERFRPSVRYLPGY